MRMDLPHRRYSMPETIMRKFRLGQYSSGGNSSSESSIKGGHQGRRKPLSRRRWHQSRVHRSAQTSPQVVVALTGDTLSPRPSAAAATAILMDSSPALTTRPTRASSVPDLSSSEETDATPYNRKLIKLRPISVSEAVGGTPSPSCYGGPEHACPMCSASWRYSSSDYTLSQTVSDRTTSTQDSTLSVQSTTPSVSTPLPFEPLTVERSIFSPAGNYIAVHTESILIRPISVVDTVDNWHFGFTPDDIETQMTMLPQSVGTITEDDIEAITSGRKHRSTSINGWARLEKGERVGDAGVNTDGDRGAVQVFTGKAIACQTESLKGVTFENEKCFESVKYVDRQVGPSVPIFKTSKSFPQWEPKKSIMKRVKAQVAVTGGNYKEFDRAKESTIARYSAVPRSNSMVVNTSSVDYTSDSDLSLTDSLEDDGAEVAERGRCENWPQTRHDSRLVRGEVSVEADARPCKRYPRGGDAYAYFLSFSGEQDIIREHSIPDWLRRRLKKREEEIKKLFEVKLNKNQTIIYRRRRKTLKHLQYESNSSNNKKKRSAVSWYDQNVKDTGDTRTIEVLVEQKGEGALQVSPNNPDEMAASTSRAPPKVLDKNNCVHISEVIRIELSDQLKTIITKEKQINLNDEAFLKQGTHVQTSEIINNENDKQIQKVELKTHVGSIKLEEDKPNESKRTLVTKRKSPYSFKQFRPLFESKADDNTVAQVLLAAMDDNNSTSGMKVSVELQTTGQEDQPVGVEATAETSCNTDQPWATAQCQTVDSFHENSSQTAFKVDKGEQSDSRPTIIVKTESRACNTGAFSVSAVVQTKESFLEEDTVVSSLFVEKGTETFAENDVNNDKCVQTLNPLVSTDVQTSPLLEDEPENKLPDKKTAPTARPHDRKGFPSDKSKDPQVLELNVPPCTCHMCTFHKKTMACERQKDGQTKLKGPHQPPTPSTGRRFETKDKKQAGTRFLPGRKTNIPGVGGKFQRKFEAIPEERASPTDESPEGHQLKQDEPKTKAVEVQTTRDDTTQTNLDTPESSRRKKKTNLVIGRFRAMPPELPGGSSRDQVPPGIEVMRQYKGRAALATAQVECQEELLTLSKGWINFYLLKDSQDCSDSTNDDDLERSRFEEQVEQYCVEIQASPETGTCQDVATSTTAAPRLVDIKQTRHAENTLILPDLPRREIIKRRHKTHQTRNNQQVGALPEIHSSSSSSTPEVQTEVNHQFQYNQATSVRKHQLPDVNSHKRTNRHEIKTRKEQVTTAVEKTTKSEPRIRIPPDVDEAVEVARSEHSVSSITSSTVILSESPSPQQLMNREAADYGGNSEQNGSSWTVTVAGSSGMANQSPPDVEMKLTFPKPVNGVVKRLENGERRSVMQYNSHHQTHISRSKRQGKMIEACSHSLRNEQHSLQYVPDIHFNRINNRHSKINRESHRTVVDDFQDDLDLSARSRGSLDLLSEGASVRGVGGGDLLVTGSAITPEMKPRVPTQSERDLVRRHRIKVPR